MGFITGFILPLVAICIAGLIIYFAVISSMKKKMEAALAALPNFSANHKIMGYNGRSGLAVDEQRKQLCLINNEFGSINIMIVNYRDVISSEIFIDGETVTRTSRGSQIGGAIIGGLALGGVGAMIGGLSGKTTSSEKVKRIELRITINDTQRPIHNVTIIDAESTRDGFIYNTYINEARRWQGLMDVIIRQATALPIHTRNAKPDKIDNTSPTASIADEISKLSKLRDQGLLTETEFISQKQRLLA